MSSKSHTIRIVPTEKSGVSSEAYKNLYDLKATSEKKTFQKKYRVPFAKREQKKKKRRKS